MPTPEICQSYNLSPKEYDDCINYRGHYSTPAYENGGYAYPIGAPEHIKKEIMEKIDKRRSLSSETIDMPKTQQTPKKNSGGYLVGPSHEQGGIPAIVAGTTPVELEGGEYIVNGQTTAALGTEFLDKLNSTQTEYHTGGFNSGELPTPSLFELGGKVNYNLNKKQVGGNFTNRKRVSINRKFAEEGKFSCPPGHAKNSNGMCMKITGYKKGGIITKKQAGGQINTSPKSKSNIKMRKAKKILKRVGGGVAKTTNTANGHNHQMIMDIYGNGHTTGNNHTHKVSNFEVGISCPENGKCHNH